MNKDKKMLFGIGIVFLFLATVGFSYAYFSNAIVQNEVKDQIVETGTLELTYTDGPEIIMNNIKPGATITKEISVKNTGTLDTSYNLVWQELANEITNDEMVIEAKCTRMDATTESESGSCNNITSKPIKDENIRKNITIEPSIVHKYDITITFKETNSAQNYNQGKMFSGVLGVNEYKAPDPVYCTFDGDMVQGAEYVNGQYTYRYMRKGRYTLSTELSWDIMTEDGWGVQLTDKTSTDEVTSNLCTYINDKPIVSMDYMFYNSKTTAIDLSSFNTSNVSEMISMFDSSAAKYLDLSGFDTSSVTNMGQMFWGSSVGIIDLSNFDTSNVITMSQMFYQSHATLIDLSNFDTSKVTDMSHMFYESKATTIKGLEEFDTSKVTDMSHMFYQSKATSLDLNSFDTSNVTYMESMFYNSKATTIKGLEKFNTSNVTSMRDMFYKTNSEVIDVSNFDTSKVTSMNSMFGNSNAMTIKGLENFDTSKVTDMSNMFSNTKPVTLDVSNFDTSKVTNMSGMFSGSQATTLDVSNFDTSKVTDMSWMFYLSGASSLDLSSFDTCNVTNMNYMFRSSPNLTTIYVSNKFLTDKVTSSSGMFSGDTKLVGSSGTKYNSSYIDKTYARIDGGTDLPGYFTLKTN